MKKSLNLQLTDILGAPCDPSTLTLQSSVRMKSGSTTFLKNQIGEAILQQFNGLLGYVYLFELHLSSPISIPIDIARAGLHILYPLAAIAPLELRDDTQHTAYPLVGERARYLYLPPRSYSLQILAGYTRFFGFYFRASIFRHNNERPYRFLHPLTAAFRHKSDTSLSSIDFRIGDITKNHIKHLVKNLKKGDLDSEKHIMDALVSLIQLSRSKVFDEYERTPDSVTLVARCRQRIAELLAHSSQPIRLKDIASQLRVSPEHLCRLHKKQHGMTLASYRDQLLVDKIKDLLQQQLHLLDISEKCGFSDASSLARFFKNKTGTTLSKYRSFLQ